MDKIIDNPGASASAIQHHYDLSNDFYKLWLDPTCTYSCGMWQERDNLTSAQLRKIDFHIQNCQVKEDHRILDIGCGWGATLKRLVEKYNIKQGVGLTLSENQANWIKKFNIPEIEINLESWSDHNPKELYDGIISIGAFEHFAKLNLSSEEKIEGYREFFRLCYQWLKPESYLSLQTITYGNATPGEFNSFLATEIFPETDLPRLTEIAIASEKYFEIVTLRNDRKDYELTCRKWLSQLQKNKKEAIELVGEKTVKNYEKYLQLAIYGFYGGKINLLRIAMKKLKNS